MLLALPNGDWQDRSEIVLYISEGDDVDAVAHEYCERACDALVHALAFRKCHAKHDNNGKENTD